MIARGFILLGFRPSGMRTGHGSLEEGGHTSSLREVRMRKITGERNIPSHLLLPIRGHQCII